jgi:phosphoribosylformylglycinamidine synthase
MVRLFGKPKALVACGHGINCEYESSHALRTAGFEVSEVHVNDLPEKKLKDFSLLMLPGGFSYGDDIASGKVLAIQLKHGLGEQLEAFIEDGKLLLAVCNGFQAAVKLGILPGFDADYAKQSVTLTFNDSGRFEDRWVYMKANPNSQSIFTKGISQLYLPVRHGEGKLVPADEKVRRRLHEKGHVALQYTDASGGLAGYPFNPNGSIDNIAGICDETGRVFGLMPHPEAFNHATNHPRWQREQLEGEGMGMRVFRNAFEYANQNL